MAVDRETSQEEMNSFATLLKTFLPDHNDLPLMGSTDELLQHVKESMQGNSSSESKQVKEKGVGQPQHKEQGSQLSVGANNIHGNTSGHTTLNNHYSIHTNTPVQLANNSICKTNQQLEGHMSSITLEQLAGENQYNTEKMWVNNTHTANKFSDNNYDTSKQLQNNSSISEEVDYDSDATIDVPLTSENSEISRAEHPDIESMIAGSGSDINTPYVKTYVCFVCDETFQELTPYSIHMKCHLHVTGSLQCSDCGETLGNEALFIAHRKLSAYEIYSDRSKVSSAQNVETEESGDDTASKMKKKKKDGGDGFYCNICAKSIRKYPSFLKHMRTHKDVYPFSCAVCHVGFQAPCMLRYHIDLRHSHVLPFQCYRCLRRFKLKCSLSTHLRYCQVDPNNLPFAEEMQFIDQLSQQRKFQGLDGENDDMSQYSCPICTMMCDSPEDLKNHMNHHDETKPFKCEQCGRGFRSKHVLRKHYAVHEPKKDCRCEICGVQLLTLSGYNAHLRGHRNQEKIQAKFFPELAAGAKEDKTQSESALQILERIKTHGDRKSAAPKEEDVSPNGSTNKPNMNRKIYNYKCPLCGMLFYSGGVKFQIHVRREHKEVKFEKCNLCNKSFYGQDNLERHIRLHKMFADSYPCDECGKTFRRKFALQVHKNMHSFKKFVKCDICGQEFRFVSEVDKHKNKRHRYDRLINIYKCSICGQKFPMLSHLSVHCYCHNMPGVKPFECDLCNTTYHTSVELKKHIFEAHDKMMKQFNETAYTSDTNKTFQVFPDIGASDSDEFPEHDEALKEGDTSQTVNVDKVSTTSTNTVKGENLSHANIEITASLKPQLLSVLQGNVKNSEETLDGVMGKDYNNAQDKNSEGSAQDEEMALPSNVDAYNLATRQFYHQTKFLKRYTCEVCQKAFSSNSDLKTHRRTHSGETPFKCDFCDRSFKQRGHRKLHIQVVHTKDMPFKCDQCDSAFPTRYRYQIHIKRHSGVREHQCAYCDKSYFTFGKLNEHRKKRHAEELGREQAQELNKEQGDNDDNDEATE